MGILNYTTKIKPQKTALEIQGILGESGASAVMSEYRDGEITAISFQLAMEGELLSFRLPINIEGVLRAIKRDCSPQYCNDEQAARTAWRILKDWVLAQVALVESNQSDMAEVFLAHIQDGSGATIYSRLKSGKFKLLN